MTSPEFSARAADKAQQLQADMQANFGQAITVSELVLVTEHEQILAPQPADVVVARTNSHGPFRAIRAAKVIKDLKPGMGFGLFTPDGVAPAIISPRSTSTELHVMYLAGDELHPSSIGDPAASFTDMQRVTLQGSAPFQGRQIGADTADTGKSPASEPGHGMNGLMALTDKKTRVALQNRQHGVHSLAQTPTGIMPAYALPTETSKGLLSTKERPLTPQEMIIGPDDKIWLFDHAQFRALSQPVEELPASPDTVVTGLTIVAAQSQLGIGDTALRSEILSLMDTMS